MKKLLYLFVYIIYFTTPFESVAIVPGFSVVKLVTILFLVVSFFYYKRIPLPRNKFIMLFYAYTILTILSTLWSVDYVNTLKNSIGTILPTFIVTLFLFKSIQNKSHIDKIFRAYSIGSIIVGLIAFYMFANGFNFGTIHGERLTVLGQDQNELSFLLSFGIVSILYLLRYTSLNKIYKLILLFFAAMLSFVILSTGSRTGFVILSIITMVVLLLYMRKKQIIIAIPVIIYGSILLFSYLPSSISERLLQTSSQIESRDMTGRGEIWRLGWQAFQYEGSYILGTGFKSFRTLMGKYNNWSQAAHNTYLVAYIELGILGIALYMCMLINLIKKTYILVKRESLFFVLLLLPLLLAMFTLGLESRRWLFLIGILIIKINDIGLKYWIANDKSARQLKV